jgi:hypothetical protein
MLRFDQVVGIDYSGAGLPVDGLPGLQVFAAAPGEMPVAVAPPAGARRWSRRSVGLWLRGRIDAGAVLLVGIDHGFSFPDSYLRRYGLDAWPAFLEDFCRHWPTLEDDCTVEAVRTGEIWQRRPDPGARREGDSGEFRLCERWTSSAKSVFQFDMQGSVAKSTHAGIPWLHWLRAHCRPVPWCWPFDGWQPQAGRTVLAEVYPSLLRNRYPREGRSVDEQDAYATARWLSELAARDLLGRYLAPPLTAAERELAAREGWILGVS